MSENINIYIRKSLLDKIVYYCSSLIVYSRHDCDVNLYFKSNSIFR